LLKADIQLNKQQCETLAREHAKEGFVFDFQEM